MIEQAGRIVRFDPATGETRGRHRHRRRRVVRRRAGPARAGLHRRRRVRVPQLHRQQRRHERRRVLGRRRRHVRRRRTAACCSRSTSRTRNHNGGDLAIGPDGMLYIAMGDGGSGGDPERRASDPTTLLGKILRIDPTPVGRPPRTRSPPTTRSPPASFDGVAGAPEVWSWGLRNPWRIDFDPATGDLWIADVGQNRLEEINVVAPTADHPAGRGVELRLERLRGHRPLQRPTSPTRATLVMPVLTYEHGDDGCSISGGAVYRGAAIPELAPAYVYSDYCSGKLWALDLAGGRNLLLREGFSPGHRRSPRARRRAVRDRTAGGLWLARRRRDGRAHDTRSNTTAPSSTSTLTRRTVTAITRIDAAGGQADEHRRLDDLDLDAPVALVDHHGVEDLALAARRAPPPRPGRAPPARHGWRAARRAPSPSGRRSNAGRDLVGHRPSVGDRERRPRSRSGPARRRSGAVAWAYVAAIAECHGRTPSRYGLVRWRRPRRAGSRAGTPRCGGRRVAATARRRRAPRPPASRDRTPGRCRAAGGSAARRRRASRGTARCRPRSSASATARFVASDSAAFCSSDGRRGRNDSS